ncbi:MAG TPA: patatin-like phospholipase family protein, partial [Deltaproteobacteria bacterium]|nr:patatin-like phospholipase family protein [Deltaproteobacteria bacterium]
SLYAASLDVKEVERTLRRAFTSEEFRRRVERFAGSGSDLDRGFMEKVLESVRKGYFFYRFMFRESVVAEGAFLEGMERIVPDMNFSELMIPFACMTLDLVSGLPQILRSGSVRLAVRASSAVPGFLPPVRVEHMVCVDGAWAESVPVSAARVLGARFVVGVDVSRDIEPIDGSRDIDNSLDILVRAGDLTRLFMNTLRTAQADFVIHPEVGDAAWNAFDDIDAYIAAGYSEAAGRIPALKKALRVHRIKEALGLAKKRGS